jgi:hypothetical protein
MVNKQTVKNEILEIINDYGLNIRSGGSRPAPLSTEDFFQVFYQNRIRHLLTQKRVGDRVLLYKIPYHFAGDIIFRYPAHHYTYLHSAYKELELFTREYHLPVPAQKITLFSTGENIPEQYGPFSLVIAFEGDFRKNESIADALSRRIKPDGQLLHFAQGEQNLKEIKALLKPFEPPRETRGRKPRERKKYSPETHFEHVREEPWMNEVKFPGLSGFLLFLFQYLSSQGVAIQDHIDYFADKISALSGENGFSFHSHYVLDVYIPKKEVAYAADQADL